MATDTSVTVREETPHANRITRTKTILNALTRRAQAVLNDTSIDQQSRAIIRYALETNDPWLARLVRRADAGESIVDSFDFSQTRETRTREMRPESEGDTKEDKIEALAEIICRGADESAAALLVLMRALEDSTHPKVLANTVKHYAFTRCGELNIFGIVDAQIAAVEGELFDGQ